MHTLQIYGDVQIVIQGKISSENLLSIDLKKVKYGLGAGNFLSLNLFGEALVFDHCAYGTVVDTSLQNCKESEEVRTPFLLAIPPNMPSFIFKIKKQKQLDVIYQELASYIENGAAVIGKGIFESFEGTYLKKSPIFSENINQYPDIYWAHPSSLRFQSALFFGVIITENGKKKFPPEQLQKGFYQNPSEKGTASLLTHSHAGLTDENFSSIQGVRHLLTQSVIQEATLEVFPFDTL